jgi:uncharacterized membrane protein YfcA
VGSLGAVTALGYMIPVLIVADIFSITYYKKNADRKSIKRLMPFAFIGIIAGTITGKYMSGKTFQVVIAVLVITSLFINALNRYLNRKYSSGSDFRKGTGEMLISKTGPVFSLATGFVSMIGGSGGPVISTYYLISGLAKDAFIGTTALFFFMVNFSKLPLYYFFWNNIELKTLAVNAAMLPFTFLGVVTGILIVRKIPEKLFRTIIFATTLLSALKLIV